MMNVPAAFAAGTRQTDLLLYDSTHPTRNVIGIETHTGTFWSRL